MRQPLITGVAGGVGTTTIAAAVQAIDGGVFTGQAPVDVLVCRDTVSGLGVAHQAVTAAPGRPLLVVVASTGDRMPRPAQARIEMVRPHADVATVPWVSRFRQVTDPWAQAASVLTVPADQVDKPLRAFQLAICELRDQLHDRLQAEPPALPAQTPAGPPRGPAAFPIP